MNELIILIRKPDRLNLNKKDNYLMFIRDTLRKHKLKKIGRNILGSASVRNNTYVYKKHDKKQSQGPSLMTTNTISLNKMLVNIAIKITS